MRGAGVMGRTITAVATLVLAAPAVSSSPSKQLGRTTRTASHSHATVPPPPPSTASELVPTIADDQAVSRATYVASRGNAPTLAVPPHSAYGYEQRVRLLEDGRVEVTVVTGWLQRSSGPPAGTPPRARSGTSLGVPAELDALAHRLASGCPDDASASERILVWVSLNIVARDDPGHDDSALSTFTTRRGSCVGRSLLAATLLEAAGIPARTVHGLLVPAHAPPGAILAPGGFQLHRWVEAWLTGLGWVPSDPGESIQVVDARHVFLATDDGEYDPDTQRDLRLALTTAAAPLEVSRVAGTPGADPVLLVRRIPDPGQEARPLETAP